MYLSSLRPPIPFFCVSKQIFFNVSSSIWPTAHTNPIMELCSVLQQIPHCAQWSFSGTWETKVSNKEKREQRKKDKSSSDGSASPGGGDTPVSTPSEQPKTTAAPAPANQKKKKGASWKMILNHPDRCSCRENYISVAPETALCFVSLLGDRQNFESLGELKLVSSEFLLRCFSPRLRGSHGSAGGRHWPW